MVNESEKKLFRGHINSGQIGLPELGLERDGLKALEVIVDGIDGSGKSTLNALLYRSLQNEGCNVQVVDLADKDPFAEERKAYKKRDGTPDPLVLLYHKSAGRRAAILRTSKELTEPSVRLYERGYVTTLAEYLAGSRKNGYKGINPDKIRRTIGIIYHTYRVPDVHIVLDCDARVAAARIAERYVKAGAEARPTAEENELVLRKMRGYYQGLAELVPNAYIIDTTNKSEEKVREEAMDLISQSSKFITLTRSRR
ncbi:hypothetical protein HYU23_02350 [Candidatus Woesearchaeota archaeon]|nr:hypothetical protein [Candidatus Woesearchaeota archaeon]